jgi:hypothetical protein
MKSTGEASGDFSNVRMVVFVTAVLIGACACVMLPLVPRLINDQSRLKMWVALAVVACAVSCSIVYAAVQCCLSPSLDSLDSSMHPPVTFDGDDDDRLETLYVTDSSAYTSHENTIEDDDESADVPVNNVMVTL